jgi:hypothetical protein
MRQTLVSEDKQSHQITDRRYQRARRTAFLARFIVLRENKRSRAHRIIETLSWHPDTSAEDCAALIRKAFTDNGDKLTPVDRDIRRALAHSDRSFRYFLDEYAERATDKFIDALLDYERSNLLLFENASPPRSTGWKRGSELKEGINKR